MQHSLQVSVLLALASISGGATVGSAIAADQLSFAFGADKVALAAHSTGSFKVVETTPERGQPRGADDTPFEVDHKLDGEADTPFELDPTVGGKPSMTKPRPAASAVQDASTNDSPFVLGKGSDPVAPARAPFLDDMPYHFVKEEQASVARRAPAGDSPFEVEGAPTAPWADATPFATDTQAASAPRTAAVASAAPLMQEFIDTQKARSAPADTTGTGGYIVRNGDTNAGPQPGTTQMVMRLPAEMAMTTDAPTMKKPFKLELGGSMVEVSPGQDFIKIPGTPFAMERGYAEKLATEKRSTPIELVRPAALIAQKAPEVRAVREVAAVAPHRSSFMRSEEPSARAFMEGNALVAPEPEKKQEPAPAAKAAKATATDAPAAPAATEAPAAAEAPAATDAPAAADAPAATDATEVDTNDAVAKGGASAVKSGGGVHQSHTTNTAVAVAAGTASALPVPGNAGHAGSDPHVPLGAASGNGSLSAPADVFNATSDEVPLNVTNITANLPKVVTVKGAIISIGAGFVVTVGFFSVLLCLLQAGYQEEKEQKEAPRQVRTYRQLFASAQGQMAQAQQPEASQIASDTASPPAA